MTTANEFLAGWYIERGISPGDTEDLEGKYHVLRGMVSVNLPPGKVPTLSDLEGQLLRENGYNV
jgi:hypothetical protein